MAWLWNRAWYSDLETCPIISYGCVFFFFAKGGTWGHHSRRRQRPQLQSVNQMGVLCEPPSTPWGTVRTAPQRPLWDCPSLGCGHETFALDEVSCIFDSFPLSFLNSLFVTVSVSELDGCLALVTGTHRWAALSSPLQKGVPTHSVVAERCGLASTSQSGLPSGKWCSTSMVFFHVNSPAGP